MSTPTFNPGALRRLAGIAPPNRVAPGSLPPPNATRMPQRPPEQVGIMGATPMPQRPPVQTGLLQGRPPLPRIQMDDNDVQRGMPQFNMGPGMRGMPPGVPGLTIPAPQHPMIGAPLPGTANGLPPPPPSAMMAGGGGVSGPGTGRSDDIPARLSDGEYVIDAETVALLGDGSFRAGAAKLDEMRRRLREHKGSALSRGKISPNARRPEAYMKGKKK